MLKAKEDLLVMAAQQGNEEAFNFLCKYYQQSLYRYAYKISSDSQLALDAVQETWLRIAKKLRELEDPRAFKSWIFRAVRWSTYDLLRKSNRAEQSLDETDGQEAVAFEVEQTNESADGLMGLIEQLPDIDKQAIHLFYLEQLKISEIAAVLQVAEGTVKSRLNRARKTLKAQLDN